MSGVAQVDSCQMTPIGLEPIFAVGETADLFQLVEGAISDSCRNRTYVSRWKGERLNRLTKEPF